jgi:Arc/MetJ-type ribon-helix-helix transcriptional regulator
MITSMTVKLAISLPDELAEAARRAVRLGKAPSVSAYIAEAIDAYRSAPTAEEFFAEVDAQYGPPSVEDVAWAVGHFERLGWTWPEGLYPDQTAAARSSQATKDPSGTTGDQP